MSNLCSTALIHKLSHRTLPRKSEATDELYRITVLSSLPSILFHPIPMLLIVIAGDDVSFGLAFSTLEQADTKDMQICEP